MCECAYVFYICLFLIISPSYSEIAFNVCYVCDMFVGSCTDSSELRYLKAKPTECFDIDIIYTLKETKRPLSARIQLQVCIDVYQPVVNLSEIGSTNLPYSVNEDIRAEEENITSQLQQLLDDPNLEQGLRLLSTQKSIAPAIENVLTALLVLFAGINPKIKVDGDGRILASFRTSKNTESIIFENIPKLIEDLKKFHILVMTDKVPEINWIELKVYASNELIQPNVLQPLSLAVSFIARWILLIMSYNKLRMRIKNNYIFIHEEEISTKRTISLVAPADPGLYMIYYRTDYQSTHSEAEKNVPSTYQRCEKWYENFVSWLLVDNDVVETHPVPTLTWFGSISQQSIAPDINAKVTVPCQSIANLEGSILKNSTLERLIDYEKAAPYIEKVTFQNPPNSDSRQSYSFLLTFTGEYLISGIEVYPTVGMSVPAGYRVYEAEGKTLLAQYVGSMSREVYMAPLVFPKNYMSLLVVIQTSSATDTLSLSKIKCNGIKTKTIISPPLETIGISNTVVEESKLANEEEQEDVEVSKKGKTAVKKKTSVSKDRSEAPTVSSQPTPANTDAGNFKIAPSKPKYVGKSHKACNYRNIKCANFVKIKNTNEN